MKTIITGGAGFIGSHLTDHLLAAGDNVTVLDDLSTGQLENLAGHGKDPRFEFIEGTILDRDLVNEVIDGADRVFHMAAAVGVHRILNEPLHGLRVNLHGSENVMEACLANSAVMVLASTSETYGKNTADKLAEDADRILGDPLLSRWSYAAAKSLDESFAHAYWREHGLKVSISRFFNTTGPRQTGFYGMVVPNLIGQALRGEPLTVFGNGRQTRCFAYVGDVIPALVRLSLRPDTRGQAFNMGGAQEVSIYDLAERIIELTDSDSPITLVPYSEAYGEGYEDMRRRVPDNSKSERVLGFSPVTGLDEIIRSIVEDMKENVNA